MALAVQLKVDVCKLALSKLSYTFVRLYQAYGGCRDRYLVSRQATR